MTEAKSTGQNPDAAAVEICYMDNAATCLMPAEVQDMMGRWCNRGNPSAEYASAREARQMMDTFRKRISIECGFELEGIHAYRIVFTSGASESNCAIIVSAVRSYMFKTGRLPHVITSATEHKSLLVCCLVLARQRLCQLTVLPVATEGPNLGQVSPEDLFRAIRPNTCIVSIMAANNETGILNNIKELSRKTRSRKIPFHTDAVQVFGKMGFLPRDLGIDAFSASFHKLGGPPGVGLLVIKRNFVDGYDLCSHICGSQNGGLRGGTENIPGIGASLEAFQIAFKSIGEKATRVSKLREVLKNTLATRLPCFYIDECPRPAEGDSPARPGSNEAVAAIKAAARKGPPVVFWIAPREFTAVLPGTILLAVSRPGFCNKAARASLEKRGVIVSLGSACNTHDAEKKDMPSQVVVAMGVPQSLHGSILRVSMCSETSTTDIGTFVKNFLAVVSSPECLSAAAYAEATSETKK
jgi:cysteine desulfurase